MTLEFLDDKLNPIKRLVWHDENALLKTVILKNSGNMPLSGVSVKPLSRPPFTHDALVKLTIGGSLARYLVVTAVDVAVDDELSLDAVNLDGVVDLSSDKARWGKALVPGVLNPGDMYEFFIRQRILPSRLNVFKIQVTNKTSVNWADVQVHADGSSGDMLSLDNMSYSQTITVGTVPANSSFTFYLKTKTVRPIAYPSRLVAASTDQGTAFLDIEPAGSHGLLCMPSDVKAEVQGLQLDELDEELLLAISMASDYVRKRTNRPWGYQEFSERLSLESSYRRGTLTEIHLKAPIIEVHRLAWLNQHGQLIREFKLGDQDFNQNITVDAREGIVYVALPVRTTDFVDIEYAAGQRNSPASVRSITARLALIRLLRRVGLTSSGGVASISLAGYGASYPEGQGFMGIIRMLMEDVERELDQLAGIQAELI